MYHLMIKKAYPTGLMYLCQTSKEPYSYKGSGKRWLNHLKAHKPSIFTCVLGTYATMAELREAGLYYSKLYDVVASDDWANLRVEDGEGGGSGKIGRRWKINDTSRMKGPKDRTTEKCKAGYQRVAEKMRGQNNPSNRFPRTEKQREVTRRRQSIATEASKKQVLVKYPDGTETIFESKRQVCYNLNISYDILNYRIGTDRDYQGITFREVNK